MLPIKLQVHTITLVFEQSENMFDSEMPRVEIDEENAVILVYHPSEQKPAISRIISTAISADKSTKIFTVKSQTEKGWMDELVYWDPANKRLKLAFPESNLNGLANYLEYQYE